MKNTSITNQNNLPSNPEDSFWFEELMLWADEYNIPESIIPRNVQNCTALTQLDFRGLGQGYDVHESISNLKNLTHLNLGGLISTCGVSWLAKLPNLTHLDLTDLMYEEPEECLFEDLKTIANLENLEYLNLSGVGDELSESYDDWRECCFPKYSFDGLNVIPDTYCEVEIIGLEISEDSWINALMNTINYILERLPNLKCLNLSFNKLPKIPEAVYKLSKLEQLIICGNGIEDDYSDSASYPKSWLNIDENIHDLSNLQVLDLRSNNIKIFPRGIIELSNLKKLDLSNNELREIPEAIEQLLNLTELDLSYNELTTLPSSFLNLGFNKWSKLVPPFKIGDMVRHAKFGQGKVLGLNLHGKKRTAKIFFIGIGCKYLDLDIVKLEKISLTV